MEYTVHKLAGLAGISTRTLRYYDGLGILKPARINSSGYRIYGSREVDRLQQIMFYRELGLELGIIAEILGSPDFDSLRALGEHHGKLLEKKLQLELLIKNVEKTIASEEGGIFMKDEEKFEGFRNKLIEENESKYGKELRARFGDEAMDESNKKFAGLSREQYEEAEKLAGDILEVLGEAVKTGEPSGTLGQKAAEMHRRWLSFYWPEYSKDAHAGLAQAYVDDERFRKYYDAKQAGTAEFLRDAILVYTGRVEAEIV
ncbi:MAG: MerR family transcriptional regulator [Clostridiales bacterium]|nr:MerR family transcriptional regulator [Clostridiales bacterium]